MRSGQKTEKNTKALMLVLMAVTGVLITVTGVIFKQSFIRVLPLYVSLIIAYMQSKVSRYALLIGGVNSILYALTYLYYHLYASMVYAAFVSCPIQIVSFVLWSKKPWKDSTVFKRLTPNKRIVLCLISVLAWICACMLMKNTDAKYMPLDALVTVIGIAATVLTMLSYVEYTSLSFLSQLCGIALYILMLAEQPEQSTYLIYSVYASLCTFFAFIRSHKIYNFQQSEMCKNPNL